MSADSCDAYTHARTYTRSRGAKNSLRMNAWMDGWEAAWTMKDTPPPNITPVSGHSLASTGHIPEKRGGASLSNQIMVRTQG